MSEVVRPYDALVANDIAGALKWYERRRAILNEPIQLHNWARLLCSLDRRSEASFLFDQLADIDDYAMFVAGQRLIESLGQGLSLSQALSDTPLGAAERHKEAIAAAMAEFDITRRPRDARHIAICGVSFCGSTLTDLLLEGLPGVSSIGESVWLTLSWVDRRPALRNYSKPRGPGIQECNYCGAACEILTPTFRNALALNPIDWYFRIAEQLRSDIIVSSDKNMPKIILCDPLLQLKALIIFKSPKQAWSSNYTKMKKDLTPEAYFEAMVKYMSVWKKAYEEFTHNFKPRGGKVFFDFDCFSVSPESSFRSLARALELEYDATALGRPSPGHSLGGNSNALRRVRIANFNVDVSPLGEPAIPVDHAAWIDNQADLTELHSVMEQLSEESLSCPV